MRLNKILYPLGVSVASAQYLNGTTTLQPVPNEVSTVFQTITNEIVSTVIITLENNEVSTSLTTLTSNEVSAVVTTLSPETTDVEPTATTTVTGESTSTTTVTVYSTITMDETVTADAVNAAVQESFAEDITSTLTSTVFQTMTLSNSAGDATATVVSAIEKQILLGSLACLPETVTVTQFEATKYVTLDPATITVTANVSFNATGNFNNFNTTELL